MSASDRFVREPRLADVRAAGGTAALAIFVGGRLVGYRAVRGSRGVLVNVEGQPIDLRARPAAEVRP